MSKDKKLYRKVNTKAHGIHRDHKVGGDYASDRNSKATKKADSNIESMGGKVHRGLDYTPLFRFLLSRVGQLWDEVYRSIRGRVESEEPIWWMVARDLSMYQGDGLLRVGESTYWNALYVDEDGILQVINPNARALVTMSCRCCTHTFNGKPL
jgi:hypothetical protein